MRKAIKQLISQQGNTTWMSTQEAVSRIRAAGMKMTIPTLIKLIVRGEIEGKKVGKRYFVATQSIENLLGTK
jgi:hypothetical protein